MPSNHISLYEFIETIRMFNFSNMVQPQVRRSGASSTILNGDLSQAIREACTSSAFTSSCAHEIERYHGTFTELSRAYMNENKMKIEPSDDFWIRPFSYDAELSTPIYDLHVLRAGKYVLEIRFIYVDNSGKPYEWAVIDGQDPYADELAIGHESTFASANGKAKRFLVDYVNANHK